MVACGAAKYEELGLRAPPFGREVVRLALSKRGADVPFSCGKFFRPLHSHWSWWYGMKRYVDIHSLLQVPEVFEPSIVDV